MPGWTKKAKIGLVALCITVGLLGSSLPASAVTGGTEVDATTFASDWSFTVAVGKAGDSFVGCTGSLVDPSTVITAGHCVDPADPPDTVSYGSRDFSTASKVAIASIERNPAYDGVEFSNDSAIVHLEQPVTGVSPIRVATADEVSTLGASVSARLGGFGLTANGVATTLLHAATATVTTTVVGSAKWLLSGGTVMTCQGDSGGPLVATLPSDEDVLIGAVSFGTQDCPGPEAYWTDLGRDTFIQDAFYPPPPPPPPVTAILVYSVSPTTGPAPLTVTFDLSGSHISDGRAATYFVDPTSDPFGENSPNSITSSTPVMQFTYNQPGTYNTFIEVFGLPDVESNTEDVTITVTAPQPQTYSVSPFSAPVDNGDTVNMAQAGRTIPFKFRVTDRAGSPVSNLTASDVSVAANVGPCIGGSQTFDAIEFYATTLGLTNVGDGYYQYDFKTSKSWAGQCGTLTVKTPYNGARAANFIFKN